MYYATAEADEEHKCVPVRYEPCLVMLEEEAARDEPLCCAHQRVADQNQRDAEVALWQLLLRGWSLRS